MDCGRRDCTADTLTSCCVDIGAGARVRLSYLATSEPRQADDIIPRQLAKGTSTPTSLDAAVLNDPIRRVDIRHIELRSAAGVN